MNSPLVTVGAINYNNSHFVTETLDSIAAQTYPNIELIIVDDASTDDSVAKIEKWLSTYKKPYKLIVHKQNQGVHNGYGSVIRNSSGEFISFIATDDLIVKEKIEEQVKAFAGLGEDYGVVYGDIVDIDEEGKEISPPNFRLHRSKNKKWEMPQGDVFKKVVKEFLIYVQSTLIRKSLLDDFEFRYKALSEDWQLIIYLARNSKFHGVDKVYSQYRRHSLSISTQGRKQERYHLWCISNVLMFHEAYGFEANNKEDKKVIFNRLRFDFCDYAYQARATYAEVMQLWKRIVRTLSRTQACRLLFFMHWLRFKLLIRKMVLNR